MIGSRAVGLLKNISRCTQNTQLSTNLQQIRHSSHEQWTYRDFSPPAKWASRSATAIGVILWYWFYWNLYHEYGHIIGLHKGAPLKDARTYTDEELGIPPD